MEVSQELCDNSDHQRYDNEDETIGSIKQMFSLHKPKKAPIKQGSFLSDSAVRMNQLALMTDGEDFTAAIIDQKASD